MKNYTVIQNEAAEKLSLNDLFVFTVLSMTAHDDNTTDVTYEQLAEFTGTSIGYIKDHFAKRLKNSELCVIEEFVKASRRRKKYILPSITSNFRIIRKELINDRFLSSEEKGFLIALYCISANNTFNMGLPAGQAIKKLGISKTAYYKHLKSLQAKGYINFVGDYPQNPQYANNPESLMLTCDWLGYKNYKEWLHRQEPFEHDTPKSLFIIYHTNISVNSLYNNTTKCA
ncbi:hypothetical protein [Alistipes provencensis]|uniref:hypothetical protein n=1 Tax=Alistipes provencensis TaxID=1816676 RepID=UPI000AEB8556|nr:hypothetical protein [Alistipes provencensis]